MQRLMPSLLFGARDRVCIPVIVIKSTGTRYPDKEYVYPYRMEQRRWVSAGVLTPSLSSFQDSRFLARTSMCSFHSTVTDVSNYARDPDREGGPSSDGSMASVTDGQTVFPHTVGRYLCFSVQNPAKPRIFIPNNFVTTYATRYAPARPGAAMADSWRSSVDRDSWQLPSTNHSARRAVEMGFKNLGLYVF